MSDFKPEIDSAAIVALGSFNPAIFQPLWFSANTLLRNEEVEQAAIQLVSTQVTAFSTDWFLLQVTQENFTIETSDPTKFFPLRDLVSGTFKILEHTPIRHFGLNRSGHFKMVSEESWHRIGHGLAPKETWNELLDAPGLRSLTIEGKRGGSDSKTVSLRVEPSAKIHPGVFFHANEHYTLAERDEAPTKAHNTKFLTTLQESWAGFLAYYERVPTHLLSKHLT